MVALPPAAAPGLSVFGIKKTDVFKVVSFAGRGRRGEMDNGGGLSRLTDRRRPFVVIIGRYRLSGTDVRSKTIHMKRFVFNIMMFVYFFGVCKLCLKIGVRYVVLLSNILPAIMVGDVAFD